MSLITDFITSQGLENKERFQIRQLDGTFYFQDEQLFEEVALGTALRDTYLLDLIRATKLIKIKRFKPINGQTFYFYSTYNERVKSEEFTYKNEFHLSLFAMGNCFKTYELANRKSSSYVQKYKEILTEIEVK